MDEICNGADKVPKTGYQRVHHIVIGERHDRIWGNFFTPAIYPRLKNRSRQQDLKPHPYFINIFERKQVTVL